MTEQRVEIREATEKDLGATVELIAAHRGGDIQEWRRIFANALHDQKRHFVVAVIGARVVGFGHAKLVARDPDDNDDDAAPPGWYLSGVTVDPECRRRGIGTALTRARLERLQGVADVVYYAAEPDNMATFGLHSPFGFTSTGRMVTVPGADRPLTLHSLAMRDA